MQMNTKSRVPNNYRSLKMCMFATQPTIQRDFYITDDNSTLYKLILSSKIPPTKILIDYFFLDFFSVFRNA